MVGEKVFYWKGSLHMSVKENKCFIRINQRNDSSPRKEFRICFARMIDTLADVDGNICLIGQM